jgi:hypothetical protein
MREARSQYRVRCKSCTPCVTLHPMGNQEATSPAAWRQTGSRLVLCRISCASGYPAPGPDDSERRHHRDLRASSCHAPCANARHAPPTSAGRIDSRGARVSRCPLPIDGGFFSIPSGRQPTRDHGAARERPPHAVVAVRLALLSRQLPVPRLRRMRQPVRQEQFS